MLVAPLSVGCLALLTERIAGTAKDHYDDPLRKLFNHYLHLLSIRACKTPLCLQVNWGTVRIVQPTHIEIDSVPPLAGGREIFQSSGFVLVD